MDPTNHTDPSACASPDGAPPSLTPAAGAQTERPVVTATAHGEGYNPDRIDVTVGGATYTVDTTGDRDDWTLPEFDDAATEIRVMVAVDLAFADYGEEFDTDARCSASQAVCL